MNSEEQNKLLTEALEFYANLDNYIFDMDGRGVSLPDDSKASRIVRDLGSTAVAVIMKIRKSKE